MQALPSFYPIESTGDDQVNGSAANSCYLDEGAPPVSATGGAARCPERSKPSFNGKQTFYNSGWLEPRDLFKLPIADDTEPGTYEVFCTVHRSDMRAEVEVRDDDDALPNNADIEEDYRESLRTDRARLAAPALLAWTTTDPTKAQAGYGAPETGSFVASFPYPTLEVKAGDPITWAVNGMHTISFDPTSDADDGIVERRDGNVVLNQAAWHPDGSPALPDIVQSEPTATQLTAVDGGTWDGDGTHHSGVLRSSAPASVSYTLRISRKDTYEYFCVIHPTMTGEVRVT
jgi:plastocyanin